MAAVHTLRWGEGERQVSDREWAAAGGGTGRIKSVDSMLSATAATERICPSTALQ